MALKHGFLLFLLTLASFVAHGKATRHLQQQQTKNPENDIVSKEEHVDCWSSLTELKSCSNEIMLYFTNGEADIGPDCCRAITVITRSCWPAMLTMLGFTADEAHYLRGYCDAAASAPASDLGPDPGPGPGPISMD